jgi:hypothetical protein
LIRDITHRRSPGGSFRQFPGKSFTLSSSTKIKVNTEIHECVYSNKNPIATGAGHGGAGWRKPARTPHRTIVQRRKIGLVSAKVVAAPVRRSSHAQFAKPPVMSVESSRRESLS